MQVSSAAGISELAGTNTEDASRDPNDLTQEDKPRSRIVAEYLAHGYVISDNAIQRAITLDNKHGVSNRFTNALTSFDAKYKATDKARGIDQSYGVTDKVFAGWNTLNSYYEKAMGTPTGQKLVSFYTQSDKQVRDIHAEARRLADLKSGKGNGGSKSENEKTMQNVPGSEKTTCQCGGNTGACPCAEGKCACSGCSKAQSHGEKSATGEADHVAATSGVEPFPEKLT